MSKLVIFDLDGTLFDTFLDIYASLKHVFNHHNFPSPTPDEAKMFIGDGLKSFLSRAVSSSHIDQMPPYLLDEYVDFYAKNAVVDTKPYPYIVDTVDKLVKSGHQLAVLSNKSEFLVHAIIKYFNMTDKFSYLAGGDTFAEKKPSPLPILMIAKSLGFDNKLDSIIMIGDSDNDTLSASNAGVRSIFCEFGYGTNSKKLATYSIDSADKICELI